MKKLSLFVLLTLISCSNSEQNSMSVLKLDCGGWGTTVTSSKIIWGPLEYFYCSKVGNWRTYSDSKECNSKNSDDSVAFDVVTYVLMTSKSGDLECKKM